MGKQAEILWDLSQGREEQEAELTGEEPCFFGGKLYRQTPNLAALATWVSGPGFGQTVADMRAQSHVHFPVRRQSLEGYIVDVVRKVLAQDLPLTIVESSGYEFEDSPWFESEVPCVVGGLGYEERVGRPLKEAMLKIDYCLSTEDFLQRDHGLKLALDYLREVFKNADVLDKPQEKLVSWIIDLGNIYKGEFSDEQLLFIKELLGKVIIRAEITYDEYLQLFEKAVDCGLDETEVVKTDSGWETG